MLQAREASRNQASWLIVGLMVVLGLGWPASASTPDPTPEDRQELKTRARECKKRLIRFYREGKLAEAWAEAQQSLSMNQDLYPKLLYPEGHADLAESLNNLGAVLRAMGRFEPARVHLEQALAMRWRLYPVAQYPEGHADLAVSLNNLGAVLRAMGQLESSRVHYERALAMNQKLYPEPRSSEGNTALANSLNNLGAVLRAMGRLEPARVHLEQALAMHEKLYPVARYPEGHHALARSFNNVGGVLLEMGRFEPARVHLEQALAMRWRLYPVAEYPEGHADLAESLNNLGFLLRAMGQLESARVHLEQGLEMESRLARIFGDLATESEAIAFQRRLPGILNLLLSASQSRPDLDVRAWTHVWMTRSAVARISEARHEALAAAGLPPDSHERMQHLLDIKRQLAPLLLQPLPATPAARDDRDRRVRDLTDAKEQLERDLARQVPALAQRQRSDRLKPADLEAALPRDSAYIDVLRYFHFTFDPGRTGQAGGTGVPHYVALVVRPGHPVRRAELGPAALIDEALANWRHAIELRHDSPAAETLRRLAWEPIARHLDSATRTVYLVPDGALARLPWAALPGSRPGTVLLEELAVAVVPHGPFLILQLTRAAEAPAPDAPVLVVGGVAYDTAPIPDDRPRDVRFARVRGPDREGAAAKWSLLPGTERELHLVCERVGTQSRPITGAEASTARLLSELPRARRAHLGTHGFFNEAAFRDEQRRAVEAIRDWKFEPDGPCGLTGAGAGARNPLSYIGLVLAGANHPEAAGPDGGILTGEMILGLDLHHLELAVLSACQTSLGEVADGQCVQNLQRAFHVAGCRNVIASLWDVPDQSTVALMDAFYEALLRDHRPPLEALREAQLRVYRDPDLIRRDDGRGAPRLDKGAKLPDPVAASPADGAIRRAAVRDWAGFVLSGPGR